MRLLHYIADSMFARNHLSFTYLKEPQFYIMSTKCFNEPFLRSYWQKLGDNYLDLDLDLKCYSKKIVTEIEKIKPQAILFSYIETSS